MENIEEKRERLDIELLDMWENMTGIVVNADIDKARNGNKSAALRIRNKCRNIVNLATSIKVGFLNP